MLRVASALRDEMQANLAGSDRTGVDPTVLVQCIANVADAYVAALSAAGNELAQSDELCAERRRRAASIVGAAVLSLGYHFPVSASGDLALHSDMRIDRGLAGSRAVFAAAELLFPIALRDLLRVLPNDPVHVASALMGQMLGEAAIALELALATKPSAEVIDRHVLGAILTSREVEVFELLLEDVPIKEISSRLRISSHTAKNHMTNISRKFRATGRVAVMRQAREIGALVAAPIAIAGAALTDTVASLGTLL